MENLDFLIRFFIVMLVASIAHEIISYNLIKKYGKEKAIKILKIITIILIIVLVIMLILGNK